MYSAPSMDFVKQTKQVSLSLSLTPPPPLPTLPHIPLGTSVNHPPQDIKAQSATPTNFLLLLSTRHLLAPLCLFAVRLFRRGFCSVKWWVERGGGEGGYCKSQSRNLPCEPDSNTWAGCPWIAHGSVIDAGMRFMETSIATDSLPVFIVPEALRHEDTFSPHTGL